MRMKSRDGPESPVKYKAKYGKERLSDIGGTGNCDLMYVMKDGFQ